MTAAPASRSRILGLEADQRDNLAMGFLTAMVVVGIVTLAFYAFGDGLPAVKSGAWWALIAINTFATLLLFGGPVATVIGQKLDDDHRRW